MLLVPYMWASMTFLPNVEIVDTLILTLLNVR